MAFQDFKMQILNAAFNLAGSVITQTMSGGPDKYEELQAEHYKKMSKIVEKAQQEHRYDIIETKEEAPVEYVAMPKKDLTSDKIEKGTACLACVPPDAIITCNPFIREIKDIAPGDKVLDGNGDYTNVQEIMNRQYDGELISIFPTYQSTLPLILTPEHPVLVLEAKMCNKIRGYCYPGRSSKKCKECTKKETTLRFMPATDIYISTRNPKKGQKKIFLTVPRIQKIEDKTTITLSEYVEANVIDGFISTHKNCIPLKNEIQISLDFMRLAGFYLAEGGIQYCREGGGNIRFHFGKHEEYYVKETIELIEKVFYLKATRVEGYTTTDVRINSVVLTRFFEKMFGRGAKNKKIPIWMMYLPHDKQFALLEGYLKGDGSQDEQRHMLQSSTISKNLAFSLRLLLFRLGILHGIRFGDNTGSEGFENHSKIFALHSTGLSAKRLAEGINVPFHNYDDVRSHEAGIDEHYIYLPISKIEKKNYSGLVMNLKTKSNTYTTQGIIVHNCSRDHFSTASGALNEALRFARKDGINTDEVQKRIGIALDELNSCERIDLAAERIINLSGKEKQIALDALNESRELRHKITAVQTPDDLERASADAANMRTRFMKSVFSIAMRDGTVDKLCRNFTGEEKSKCMKTLTSILEEKKESEMK